jgi:hypothetical protein
MNAAPFLAAVPNTPDLDAIRRMLLASHMAYDEETVETGVEIRVFDGADEDGHVVMTFDQATHKLQSVRAFE